VSSKRKRSCLITGAAGGIGYALVEAFQSAGYFVIATDITPKPPDLACDYYLPADLIQFTQDENYAQQISANIQDKLDDGLDVLINNAAIQILGGTDSLTRQNWQTTMDVNLLAPFLLTQSLLSKLEAAKGSVINIGSIHARLTKKNFVAYATSKAAIAGLTRAMAVDLGPRVRVNCIEPAAIETEMLKAGFEGKPDSYNKLKACHPRQKIGQPSEVAKLALLLANDELGFLHGVSIGLDGGIGNKLLDPN